MPMRWDYVSELRPPTGLLFIPQMIYECGEPRWIDIDRGKPKNLQKICPNATLSTINLTWADMGSNPDLRSDMPETNRLVYGTARTHPSHPSHPSHINIVGMLYSVCLLIFFFGGGEGGEICFPLSNSNSISFFTSCSPIRYTVKQTKRNN
jgi:hypothetical protein